MMLNLQILRGRERFGTIASAEFSGHWKPCKETEQLSFCQGFA
jgi:hypothetical protein